jgi:hypothetical protein
VPERESIERGFPYLLSAQKLVRAVFVKNGEGVGELGPQRYNAATYSVTVFKEVASTWVWSGTVKSTQSSPLGTVCSRESYCGQFSHVLLSVGCEAKDACICPGCNQESVYECRRTRLSLRRPAIRGCEVNEL